jgi:flavoprotein, HI0933 family
MEEGGDVIFADVVLMACGGKASPKLGSDGSGLAMMETMGFACSPLYPAMVQICTETAPIQSLKGIKFEGQASLWRENACIASESGEILFTEYGISGLPTFQLSIHAGEYWRRNPKDALEIRLDFLPEMDEDVLMMQLMMRTSYLAQRDLQSYFSGLLNKRIGLVLLKAAHVLPLSRKIASIGEKEWKQLAKVCKAFPLAAKKNRPFDQAQVTAGGLCLKEFDADLQSKRFAGLFATGEILDVHGDCGGYNLQWAWSSAAAAVQGIVKYLRQQNKDKKTDKMGD